MISRNKTPAVKQTKLMFFYVVEQCNISHIFALSRKSVQSFVLPQEAILKKCQYFMRSFNLTLLYLLDMITLLCGFAAHSSAQNKKPSGTQGMISLKCPKQLLIPLLWFG